MALSGIAVQHADDGYSSRANFGGLLVHNFTVWFLIYSPNGTNDYGSITTDLDGSWSVKRVESCKIVFLGGHFLFICSDTFAVGRIL